MAHIGEIINADTLKENYDYFLRFLRYMPDILEGKKETGTRRIYRLPSYSEKKREGLITLYCY